jgi:D-xylose transport system permease protein
MNDASAGTLSSATFAEADPVPAVPRMFGASILRGSALLLILMGIWLFFYFATDGTFLTQRNLVLLALQSAIVSLAAISAVMLIVSRNFDLSVGSAVALVGVVVAVLTVKWNVPVPLAILASLGVGMLMGVWQGLWVTRLGVSSFIVTLAGMLYFRGMSMIITNGETVAPVPASMKSIATGFLPPAWSAALVVAGLAVYTLIQIRTALKAKRLEVIDSIAAPLIRTLPGAFIFGAAAIWLASWQGIPFLVLLVAACAIAAETLMRATPFGAKLYALGGNPEAARLSGVDLNRVVFTNFVIAGFAYGVIGVALTARVSGAVAGSAGLFLELDAIAAAIIGGTALTGGKGRIFGAILGALLMGSLNNGMSLMNVPTFYQDTARGIVLLLAVALDQYGRRRNSLTRADV